MVRTPDAKGQEEEKAYVQQASAEAAVSGTHATARSSLARTLEWDRNHPAGPWETRVHRATTLDEKEETQREEN